MPRDEKTLSKDVGTSLPTGVRTIEVNRTNQQESAHEW